MFGTTTPAFKVGDMVYFGRTHGEKTLGKIAKVNPKKYKVTQMEDRGSIRDYKIGTIWTVPFNLVSAAPGTVASAPAKPPVVAAPARPAATSTVRPGDRAEFTKGRTVVTGTAKSVNVKSVTLVDCDDNSMGYRVPFRMIRPAASKVTTPKAKRSDDAILSDIRGVYSNLSPENLSWDGERSRAQIAKAGAALRRQLATLFAEIGRIVSESEAFSRVSA